MYRMPFENDSQSVKLDFKGFVPSNRALSILKNRFDDLDLKLPSDATLYAVITKGLDNEYDCEYVGRVSVNSTGRKLVVKSKDKRLGRLFRQLEAGIRHQIELWNKSRLKKLMDDSAK